MTDLGTLSADGSNAVGGTVGALPPSTLFTARVRDGDTGRILASARVADETDVGNPLGDSLLDLVATGGTASLASEAFGGAPAAETGRMCARFTFRELRRPVRFCNRYVGTGGAAAGIPPVVPSAGADDLASAISLIVGADFAALHVTRLQVDFSISRGLRQAFIRSASAPRHVRRGARVLVTLRLRRYRGAAEVRRVRVRVPRSLRPGRRRLVLAGPADDSGDLTDVLASVLGTPVDGGAGGESTTGPGTRAGLARAIRGLSRYDGVSAIFGHAHGGAHVLRDPSERISGAAIVTLEVR